MHAAHGFLDGGGNGTTKPTGLGTASMASVRTTESDAADFLPRFAIDCPYR